MHSDNYKSHRCFYFRRKKNPSFLWDKVALKQARYRARCVPVRNSQTFVCDMDVATAGTSMLLEEAFLFKSARLEFCGALHCISQFNYTVQFFCRWNNVNTRRARPRVCLKRGIAQPSIQRADPAAHTQLPLPTSNVCDVKPPKMCVLLDNISASVGPCTS